MNCPKCGEKVFETDQTCMNCGETLTRAAARSGDQAPSGAPPQSAAPTVAHLPAPGRPASAPPVQPPPSVPTRHVMPTPRLASPRIREGPLTPWRLAGWVVLGVVIVGVAAGAWQLHQYATRYQLGARWKRDDGLMMNLRTTSRRSLVLYSGEMGVGATQAHTTEVYSALGGEGGSSRTISADVDVVSAPVLGKDQWVHLGTVERKAALSAPAEGQYARYEAIRISRGWGGTFIIEAEHGTMAVVGEGKSQNYSEASGDIQGPLRLTIKRRGRDRLEVSGTIEGSFELAGVN